MTSKLTELKLRGNFLALLKVPNNLISNYGASINMKNNSFLKQVGIVSLSVLILGGCSSDDDSSSVPQVMDDQPLVLSNSDVDFSNCREIAGGMSVSKSDLQAEVPMNVPVNSLTDAGTVFEGSDDLGLLIIRSLSCEAIRVTDSDGNEITDDGVVITQVGTPINTSGLPATTFSNDGFNGADFNIYTLSYQTSSPAYFGAMQRAGLQNISLNTGLINILTDLDAEQCSTASLMVEVPGDDEFAFSISGEVVEATDECNPGGVDFIANWWSVDSDNQVSVLSNNVVGQTFTETAGPNVLVKTSSGKTINDLIGEDESGFTAFSGSGYIISGGLGDRDMVSQTLGMI